MKHVKRVLAFICAFAILITAVPPVNVFAEDADIQLYTEMFSVPASAYYMTCQPEGAIILNDVIELTPSMLSKNYKGGVVDLPRLQSKYYYLVSDENKDYWIGDTLYPTLCWNTAAIGTETTLSICSEETQKPILSLNVYISWKYDRSMKGIDDCYKVKHVKLDSNGNEEVYYTVEFHDCSEGIVDYLTAIGDSMRHYTFTPGTFSIYDTAMQKNCIVMDTYAYTPDNVSSFSRLDSHADEFVYENFDEMAYTFAQNEGDKIEETSHIKEHLGTLNQGTRAGLLFYGSKTQDCLFNNNRGIAQTTTTINDYNTLYYFIALSSGCYFSKVEGSVADKELNHVIDTTPPMTWSANKSYCLQSGTDWLDAGYTGNPDKSNPNYLNYGPVDFTKFNDKLTDTGTDINFDSDYKYFHNLTTTVDKLNLYASSLIYSASIPHLGNLTLQKASSTVTVNYYYRLPESETWTLLSQPISYSSANFASVQLLDLPDQPFYEKLQWYTDANLSTKVNQNSYPKTENSVINLYGGYSYNGGYYTVTFYDDLNKKEEMQQFKVIEQPSLPPTPEGSKGTSFKRWLIVNAKEDTSGVAYSAETFKPVVEGKYIFKTSWGTTGVITSVTTEKTDYYLGEELDKSKFKVQYKDDDTGTVKIATENDFSLDKNYLDKVGSNTVTITLNSSGYQYTISLNGVKRDVKSITATYNGGDVKRGAELEPGDFTVKLTYADGSEGETTNFSVMPNIVNKVGKNTITIQYLDLTTTCLVNCVEGNEYEAKNEVAYIKAKYTSDKIIFQGDTIKSSDLQVIAYYDNGNKVTLGDGDFTFAPTAFDDYGEQLIVIAYAGKTTSVKVTVLPKKIEINTGNDKDDNNSNNNNNSNGNNNNSNKIPSYPSNNSTPSNSNNSNTSKPNSSSSNNKPSSSSNNNKPSSSNTPSTNTTPANTHENDSENTSKPSGTSGSNSDNDKGTSIGYLNGANILTNVISNGVAAKLGTDDIKQKLEETDEGSQVNITLSNGYVGNQITTEEMQMLRDKKITAYIRMVDSTDNSTPVADWTLKGSELGECSFNINPNIIFETTDQENGRLLYFSTSQSDYPEGISLTVTPLSRSYTSGALVRLYSCTADYGNASMLRALTWLDSSNVFPIDLSGNTTGYCLSDSLETVEEGGTLIAAPTASPNDEEMTDVENTEEWPSDTELDEDTQKFFKNVGKAVGATLIFTILLWIFVGVLIIVIIVLIIRTIIKHSNKKKAMQQQQQTYAENPTDNSDYSNPAYDIQYTDNISESGEDDSQEL